MIPDWKFLNDFKRKHIKTLPGRHVHYNELKLPHRAKQGWTPATVRTTIEVVMWFYERGFIFATEVPMIGSTRRADVLIPEFYEAQVIEIQDSESDDSIRRKAEEYRMQGLTFLSLPANPVEAINILDTLEKFIA
jgi:hypothetical protein